MKKMFMKVISIFCALALMLAVVAGCGSTGDGGGTTASGTGSASAEDTTAAPTEEKLPEATVTFEVSAMPPTVAANQDDNVLVKQIYDKLNIKLRFMCDASPANDAVAKMRLNLSTQQSGDIIGIPTWGSGAADLMLKGVQEGLFINMSDYIAKYPGRYPTLEKCFNDPIFQYYNMQYYKQPQENFAFWAAGYTSNPTGAPLYNMQIMKDVGGTMPTTLDEFVNYLRLVKQNKPAVIPFYPRSDKGVMLGDGSCEINQIFFQTQGADFNHMLQDADGNWYDSAIDEKNKAIWKQLAGYYKEGLIDKELFTTDVDSFMTDKFMTNKLAVATCFLPNQNFKSYLTQVNNYITANPTVKKEDILDYMQVQPAPLTGPGGSGYNKATTFTIHYGTFISSNSKNPERTMDLLNYLLSDEGMTLMWYGIKGVHYQDQDAEGNVTGFDAAKMEEDNKNWQLSGTSTFWLCFASASGQIYFIDRNNGWAAALKKQSGMKTADQPQAVLDYSIKTWTDWSTSGFKPKPAYQSALNQIASVHDIFTKLKDIKTRYMSGFIFGSIDVDSNWDKFVKELKDAGLDEYVQAYNETEESARNVYVNIVGSAD